MPPKHMLTAILAITLIAGASYCFKHWLSARVELRKLEMRDQDRKA